MSVTAALIGAGASLAGTGASGLFGRANAKQQFEHSKELYQNRHQWEVQDLRKAGLNPILSAHGSPPTPSVSQAPTPDFSSAGRDATAAVSASSARKLMKEQENLVRAQADQAYTAANKNRADALEAIGRAGLIGQEADLNRANPDEYKSKMLQSPVTREVQNIFSGAKQAAEKVLGGTTSVFTDINNARKAANAANRGKYEVRKHYPNYDK